MEQSAEIFVDIYDPDLKGPYCITATYFNKDPKSNETVTILSDDTFHLHEDITEAFNDWGSLMPPKEKINNLKQRFGVDEIFVEVSLYDAHNCEIATSNFKWEDDE